MRKGYRILSVESADIYKNEQENGALVGYRLPDKADARFRLFKILLDDSFDSKELEKAYTRLCRRKFSFQDEYENAYTLANLSQKLNSILWDTLSRADKEAVLAIYEDICKLAVLSGLEIDKAKRSFEDVRVGKELAALWKEYALPAPTFFAEIDESNGKEYAFYHTAMDYLYTAQALKKHYSI